MHTDSLPLATQGLLRDCATHCPDLDGFLLVGGTALSLQAAHRLSEDLDFAWPEKKLDRAKVRAVLDVLSALGKTVVYNNPPDKVEEAINDGIDLDDYQQDYMVGGVKLTFFAFGDYDRDRQLIRTGLADSRQIGHVAVADIPTLFATKCIVLTDRIKSRDLFDLWWMTHRSGLAMSTQSIFETVQQYRPHLPYEHVRHRLLDWQIPATDESFDKLVAEPITIESLRGSFRSDVDQLEENMAISLKDGLTLFPSLANQWNARPAIGPQFGEIKAISDQEIIQHVGQGRHVGWDRSKLTGDVDVLEIGSEVEISKDGVVRTGRVSPSLGI